MPKKILVLTTYPIENPIHGGQFRVLNIVKKYRDAAMDVQVCGILGSEQYCVTDDFLNYPAIEISNSKLERTFLLEDLSIALICGSNDNIYKRLKERIKFEPDVIQIEHPWLLYFAQRYAHELNNKPELIYSSHNIESNLKFDILKNYIPIGDAERYANQIKLIEIEAIRAADKVICVSESDADWIKNIDNTAQVLVAPNGVSQLTPTQQGKSEAQKVTKGLKYALYCGSAHPPNIEGFFHFTSGGFGSLKPDERLVLVGGVGYAIASDERVHKSAKLAEKVDVAGFVSPECLASFLADAHCLLLPLSHGGGTNLKTAEALWSGKYILASTTAMRGFEDYIGSPGVFIADSPEDFKRTLREIMLLPELNLDQREMSMRKLVLWDNCLRSVSDFVNAPSNLK